MRTADDVVVGSRWAGITGDVMEVAEIDGDVCRLVMVGDEEDESWEECGRVAKNLRFVRGPVEPTARAPFPMLFDLVEDGEVVTICRLGEPVAVLIGIDRYETLRAALADADEVAR